MSGWPLVSHWSDYNTILRKGSGVWKPYLFILLAVSDQYQYQELIKVRAYSQKKRETEPFHPVQSPGSMGSLSSKIQIANYRENRGYHSQFLISFRTMVIPQLWWDPSFNSSLCVMSSWQRQLALWLSAVSYYFFTAFLRCSWLFSLSLGKLKRRTG